MVSVDGAAEPAAKPRRPRSPATWWGVGIAAMLGNVGVAALSYYAPEAPFVLGSYVPRSWHLAGLLIVLGLAALMTGAWVRVAAEDHGQAEPRSLLRRVAVVPTTLATLLVAAVALLIIGLATAVTSYHVLQPAGHRAAESSSPKTPSSSWARVGSSSCPPAPTDPDR